MKRIISDLILYILILVFIYASFSKLFYLEGFRVSMSKQPFPAWMSTVLVYTIPAIEIAICILLLIPKAKAIGYSLYIFCMSVFTAYAALVYFQVWHINGCPCGGIISEFTWKEHLLFNILITLLAICGKLISRAKSGHLITPANTSGYKINQTVKL